MSHGGKRNGAGRPKRGMTKKSVEIARQAADEGITPLEVMVANMRRHWEAKRYDEAQSCAVDAAPFMHAKLASVKHAGDAENPLTIVHELLESVDGLTRGLPNGEDENRQSH